MSDLIIRPKMPPSCGNCHFARPVPQNLQAIICAGVPPTPVVLSGRPNGLGGVEMQIELIRPQLARGEAACALWAERQEQAFGVA